MLGTRFDPWSGNWIPHATTKSSHAATKTWYSQINKYKRKKMYIYIMEYCLVIKKNEVMLFAATWMDVEIIILSDVNQKDKHHNDIIHVKSKL